MKSLLLLLALFGEPFDFVKKPEVEAPAPAVRVEEFVSQFVGPIDDHKERYQELERQHEILKASAIRVANENEKLAGAVESEANWRDNKIAKLEKENAELRSGTDKLRQRCTDLEKSASDQPNIEITDFSKFVERPSSVQIVITTSDGCSACKPFISKLIAMLQPHGFHISTDPGSPFYIHSITQAEWVAMGYTLPHVELIVRGQSQELTERDPYRLGHIWNAAVLREREMPPLPGAEQVAGMTMATVQGKEQVTQMLAMLEPFLDGGTLQVIYTAKPGVIKNFLTIKRGPIGMKIPPKTTFELSMKAGDLTVKLIDPKPELLLGPLDRGIQEIDITPNKISLRLPWMIDPELKLK